jgi:hypothetical protein
LFALIASGDRNCASRAAAMRRFPARQGIAVIGRNNRTTLVTSVQELLDRTKRRKFSMRRLPFLLSGR